MEHLIRELIADVAVTDVLVNGDGSVWVDRGRQLERADLSVPDGRAVRRLAVRLAAAAQRRLDVPCPMPTVSSRVAADCMPFSPPSPPTARTSRSGSRDALPGPSPSWRTTAR